MQNFRALGAIRSQTPVPPAAGGSAPRPPKHPPLRISGYAPVRKGVQIRRNIASHLCIAVGCQQFCKESRKRPRRIMFERNYSFFHHCLWSCLCVMFLKEYFELTTMGGGAKVAVRGGTAPPGPPVATALVGRRGEQISLVQTYHRWGSEGRHSAIFWNYFFIKNSYFNAIWITFRTFLEPFKMTKFLRIKSQLK